MDIVFKEATKEDSELLRSIEAGDGYPYPRKKTKEDYERYIAEGTTFFIANVNGKPAGYISIVNCNYLGNECCRLHFLAVLAEYQSKGVGTKLIEHFENQAKNRGYDRIIVNVYGDNQRAIKFYEKQGYKHWFTTPYRYENGIDAYVMFKDIGTKFAERIKNQSRQATEFFKP